MRLTKHLRAAFVRDVVNNIPTKNYKAQIIEELMSLAVAALPKKVHALWVDKELRCYVATDYWYVHEYSISVKVPWNGTKPPIPPTVADKLAALHAADINQAAEINTMTNKLQAIADGCTNTKKLAELLPELVQYIPTSDRQACTNLPVAADVMPSLKALGFPKKHAKGGK